MWIPVSGRSMGWSIPDGARVLVEPGGAPRAGEVWAFCDAHGTVVVHRARRPTSPAHWRFQGDARVRADPPATADRLVGRVVAVRHGDRRLARLRWGRAAGLVQRAPRMVVAAGARASRRLRRGRVPAPERVALTASAVVAGAVVDVGGLAIGLSASDARRGEAVVGLLRHAAPALGAEDAVLCFEGTELPVPDGTPRYDRDGIEVWWPGPGLLVVRERTGLVARATADEIVVGGDSASLDRAFRSVSLFALAHVLAHHGTHVLHSAALLVDGRVVLVLGDSGAGKSTLALAALTAPPGDWRVLGDDLVVVHAVDGGLSASGIARPITVPTDVVPDPPPGSRPLDGDPRARLELPTGPVAVGRYPVVGLIEASLDGASGALVRLGTRDAFRATLRASPSLADPTFQREVFGLATALTKLPAWRLTHDAHASSRLRVAGERLAEVRARIGAAS
jgi:hypothetical protein